MRGLFSFATIVHMVVAGIPTRGLVISRTIEGVLQNTTDIIFAHGMPVPDAHNYLVTRFLETTAQHLWLVDDDMLIPKGILNSLLSANVDVALADYPLETGNSVQRLDGEFLFGGLGCTLIKRHVLESGIRFRTHRGYTFPDLKPVTRSPDKHGGQDVDFYVQVKERGFTTQVIKRTCGHMRVEDLHRRGNNTAYEMRIL